MTLSNRIYNLYSKNNTIYEKKMAVNLQDLLVTLAHNRLLYWFCKNYHDQYTGSANHLLVDIYKRGQRYLNTKDETIQLLNKISRKQELPFILAKSKRSVPYINMDIDLLINKTDDKSWINALKSNGYNATAHKTFLSKQANQDILLSDKYYKIDITTDFNWRDNTFFDNKFLWDKYNKETHEMNSEADFAVNLATILFKRIHFNIIDYDYLITRLSSIEINIIREQASKYHWVNSLDIGLKTLSQINPNKDIFPYKLSQNDNRMVFKEELQNRRFSLNYFTYILLAKTRYQINKRKYLPYHVHWYPYDNLINVSTNKIIQI